MEDIERDWDKPVAEAGIAAKASVIVRVGMLDLGAGTGSFRVREMMHRIAYPLGVHVRADVNLTDIEAACTDGKDRITEVVDLPTTGVNTERIWLLEHFADWFNVNLGEESMYHAQATISEELVEHLDSPDARHSVMRAVEKDREAVEAIEALDAAGHKGGGSAGLDSAGIIESAGSAGSRSVGSISAAGTGDGASTPVDVPATNPRSIGREHTSIGIRPIASPKTKAATHRPPASYAEHFDHHAPVPAQSNTATANAAAATSMTAADTGIGSSATTGTATSPVSSAPAATNPPHAPAAGTPASHGVHRITVREAHERLDLIERRKPLYSPAFAGLASAVACASFVFLLGGGIYDMVGAFVGAGLGHWLRRRLFAHHLNQFFVTFVCVAVAALACTGMLRLIGMFDPVALQHDTAYIGAMLFVIPGFPLITGGLDMAKIDFPSGVQRVTYVMCIVLMATLAGWMVACIVHLNPTGFESLGLDPVLNGALRFVAAFCGVWGFSVLFNSPQRMCLTAAVIGALTDTLRLELVDFAGVPAEAGAFIGALLAGLLASAWRSSVRRGWLPPYLDYPRICLTVPSIVIMVPGLYMYQAMFHLGQFDTQLALDWAFRAFMVIICLPIGLAMARVITDKSWRYDI